MLDIPSNMQGNLHWPFLTDSEKRCVLIHHASLEKGKRSVQIGLLLLVQKKNRIHRMQGPLGQSNKGDTFDVHVRATLLEVKVYLCLETGNWTIATTSYCVTATRRVNLNGSP